MKPWPTADELGDDGIFRHSAELQRDWYASEVVPLLMRIASSQLGPAGYCSEPLHFLRQDAHAVLRELEGKT